jgi:hypothetical protein
LEEELKFAKELAANESKFATVAKKTAEDAIKQVFIFHFVDYLFRQDTFNEN